MRTSAYMRLQHLSPSDVRLPAGVVSAASAEDGLCRCVFFVVTNPGILETMGSDGSAVLCAPARAQFSRFVVLTAANAMAPNVWDIGRLFHTAAMPAGVVASLLRSLTGPAWSELARPTDQHGEFADYVRDHELLPCAAERIPDGIDVSDRDYRFLLNVLDPEAMLKVKTSGVKVGPSAMAAHFGVQPSHMPRVFRDKNGTWQIEYKTFLEVLIVYGSAGSSSILKRYIEVDGVAQPIPGCTVEGPKVTVTLDLHFKLTAGTRSKRMWHDIRDRAAGLLERDAEPFIEMSPSGEMLSVRESAYNHGEPSALDICVAGIMIARAERKRLKLAQVLQNAGDFPKCQRLDPVSWYDSNNVETRRQQIFTMTGLRFEGYAEIADQLLSAIRNVYDNAFRPAGVSHEEFNRKMRERRSSVFSNPKSLYRAPRCSSCPLGFSTPERCLLGPYDPHAHVTVADVIIANARHRADEDDEEEALDRIASEMDV